MNLRCDAVVLGAGAAGLAAARVLSQAGCSAIVLEARDRVGGRIYTREDAGLPVPIDLGGEFIHGATEISFALLRSAGTVAVDTGGDSYALEDGELRDRGDPFAAVQRVMKRARDLPEDVSIEEFLRGLPDDLDDVERVRRNVRMMVEGFDAADPRRASTRALAEEWGGGENGQTSEQFRPVGGYGPLLRALLGALDPARVHVRLATAVHAVRRIAASDGEPDRVVVEATTCTGEALSVRARAAIVTLPVGVLQANDVRFEPELPQRTRAALERIVMGPVIKLALRFRTRFWERVHAGRYRDGAFFYNGDGGFPVFWTLLPMRTPLLIAWAGGPRAAALSGRDEPQLVRQALNDLAVLFGDEADPHGELEAAYAHDWDRDPYARGAYSYVSVGAGDPRGDLAAPVDGVLFFAGEATSPIAEAGTVAGALQTGERAAREVLGIIR